MTATFQTRSYPVGPSQPSVARLRRLALQKRQDLLSRSALFQGLSGRHLRSLARATTLSTHPAGRAIVEAGQPGSTFYAIVEGKAKVVRGGRTMTRLGPGDFFGEIAILDPGPRTASVIAEDDTVCLQLGSKEFHKVVASEPQLAKRMLQTLARWLRQSEPKHFS